MQCEPERSENVEGLAPHRGTGSVSVSDIMLTRMSLRTSLSSLLHASHYTSRTLLARRLCGTSSNASRARMGKKKSSTPGEEHLLLPVHPSRAERPETDHELTVDTHTHLVSTFNAYQAAYKPGKYQTIWEFVRNMYGGRRVEAIVDVWCEAPVLKQWKEIADSALTEEQREKDWGGIDYWFVMGKSQDM